MTPFERAARVLAQRYIMDREARAADDPYVLAWVDDWEAMGHGDDARAMIAALREPSSAMTHAAQSESHVAGGCEVDYHGIWASMIDAALTEPV